MLKICFISFYEIKEYILSIKLGFEGLLYTVENYPLFRYAYDANDKVEHCDQHMATTIQNMDPDVVFCIFSDVNIDYFKLLKNSLNRQTIFILYLPDFCVVDDIFLQKVRYFDFLVVHKAEIVESIISLSDYDLDRVLLLPPCFDHTLYHAGVKPDAKYNSDLVYLNYVYDENSLSAVQALAAWAETRGLVFKIYGSVAYGEVCTKNYCGGFSYIEYPVICKSRCV